MSSWNGMSRTGAAEDEARPAEPRKNCIGIGKVIVLSVGVGLAAMARPIHRFESGRRLH